MKKIQCAARASPAAAAASVDCTGVGTYFTNTIGGTAGAVVGGDIGSFGAAAKATRT